MRSPEVALRAVLAEQGPQLDAFARALLGEHESESESVLDGVCLNVLIGALVLPEAPAAALRAMLGEIHRVVTLTRPVATPVVAVNDADNDNEQSRAA